MENYLQVSSKNVYFQYKTALDKYTIFKPYFFNFAFISYVLWMKNVACHISKQRMLRPSSQEGAQDGDKQAAHCQAISHCSNPQLCILRALRMEKHRILALDSKGVYQRNNFNEPRLLHLPYIENAKFINPIYLVFFNSNLLMFRLPGLPCKTPMYLGSSLTSSEPSLRASERLPPGPEVLRKSAQ